MDVVEYVCVSERKDKGREKGIVRYIVECVYRWKRRKEKRKKCALMYCWSMCVSKGKRKRKDEKKAGLSTHGVLIHSVSTAENCGTSLLCV